MTNAFAEIAERLVARMQCALDEQVAKHENRVSPGAVKAYRSQVEHEIKVVRSRAMRNAFEGTALLAKGRPPTITKAVRRVVGTLAKVEAILKYCRHIVPAGASPEPRFDVADVLEHGEQLAEKRTQVLEHITVATALLSDIRDPEYAAEFRALAERMGKGKHGTLEEWVASTTAERPSRRGKAAGNRDGAARQWAVRVLAASIPADSRKRYTATAELLQHIGLEITATSVYTTLTRSRD